MYPTIINFGTIHLGPVRLPIAIHSFGLMVALSFLTVMFTFQRELARKQLNPKLASSIIFAGAVGGIVGAKLYSALQDG
ncbi:prolipoprotein diacylglyceryl transferase, partial [Candidatus Poribacteria bacterium]|nr:prolipoprotein diacylglyceryl transferase [Candidatus Poribacteria bacterium]